jgi:hypothetical protein
MPLLWWEGGPQHSVLKKTVFSLSTYIACHAGTPFVYNYGLCRLRQVTLIRIWLDFYEDDMSPWVLSSIHIQRLPVTTLIRLLFLPESSEFATFRYQYRCHDILLLYLSVLLRKFSCTVHHHAPFAILQPRYHVTSLHTSQPRRPAVPTRGPLKWVFVILQKWDYFGFSFYFCGTSRNYLCILPRNSEQNATQKTGRNTVTVATHR